MKEDLVEMIEDAEFLGTKELSGCDSLPPPTCDAGPLPPGCNCVCDTPCDFGKSEKYQLDENPRYNSKPAIRKVYEID